MGIKYPTSPSLCLQISCWCHPLAEPNWKPQVKEHLDAVLMGQPCGAQSRAEGWRTDLEGEMEDTQHWLIVQCSQSIPGLISASIRGKVQFVISGDFFCKVCPDLQICFLSKIIEVYQAFFHIPSHFMTQIFKIFFLMVNIYITQNLPFLHVQFCGIKYIHIFVQPITTIHLQNFSIATN